MWTRSWPKFVPDLGKTSSSLVSNLPASCSLHALRCYLHTVWQYKGAGLVQATGFCTHANSVVRIITCALGLNLLFLRL